MVRIWEKNPQNIWYNLTKEVIKEGWMERLSALTQWGQAEMPVISQTTFSNAFSCMKMYRFGLRFHWRFSQGSNWQYTNIGADQATRHYLNQRWLFFWCIHASLGLNELTGFHMLKSYNEMTRHVKHNAVEYRYNVVRFTTILFKVQWWQQLNLNQTSNSQHTPHSSPSRVSYGEYIVRIVRKLTAL